MLFVIPSAGPKLPSAALVALLSAALLIAVIVGIDPQRGGSPIGDRTSSDSTNTWGPRQRSRQSPADITYRRCLECVDCHRPRYDASANIVIACVQIADLERPWHSRRHFSANSA
ncbi:MAG: hypothetical protein ACREM8_12640 [Vulcanimicrobiaceae bacterium]